MFLAACFCGLLGLPPVLADGWDDFSNNLATDLAPLLSLFGEQITKQYLSESITMLDYFIFAMAPMGILTAVVSAIRVCGSPSLRAFIGRAQEGGGNAEAELCSSTSRDVCELYNNGGIARVFGRPKILEVVYDPAKQDSTDGTAGIYTFRDYLRNGNGEDEWKDERKHESKDPEKNDEPDAFAPNLSLNVGIKRKPQAVFGAVALIGLILQTGVLLFAAIVTYYLQWEKDGSRPESYACPLTIIGTVLVCSGVFLCAFLVGQSTDERVYRRKGPAEASKSTPAETSKSTPSFMYWVQPGGQVLGDQTYDPFCYSDCDEPLQEYIASWKHRSSNSELVVWAAVGTTITGFVMQFVGLRGIHSAVSVAQLGVIMAMSAARAALRMQRLKPEDNFLAQCPDEVVGHELDWLAVRIRGEDIQRDSSPAPSSGASTSPREPHLWRFCGTPGDADRIRHELPPTSDGPNAAGKLLTYRTRLAQLTQSPTTQTKAAASAHHFDVGMVEVRENAQRLALAIESAANTIFSKSPKIRDEWKNAKCMYLGFACDIASKELPTNSEQDKAATKSPNRHIPYLHLWRESPENPWRLQSKLDLEGLLGLWVWSLKSDPAVEVSDSRSRLTVSRATEVLARRIVSTNQNIAETDLKIWLGGDILGLKKDMLHPTSIQRGNSSRLPENPDQVVRFFVWSAPTNTSLLSLCTQEAFGMFIKSILDVVDDFGSMDIQQETQHFRLENSLVSELARLFTESRLGPREDALLCVLPPMISRLALSSTGGAVEAARKSANQHRKHDEWMQAETVLRWAWGISQPSHASTGRPILDDHTERAAIALGELYRWALLGNDTKQFGLRGIEWLSGQKSGRSQPLPAAITEIIGRYSDIAKEVDQQEKTVSGDGLLTAMRDGLPATLRYLTLSTSMTNEEKGKALCLAAKHGWVEVVLALLELGAEPDFKDADEDSRTALSHAAQSGSIDTVKELMDWGSFPNSADAEYRTPLSYASELGRSSIVAILLRDRRVDPDAKDKHGQTPLSRAAEEGHEAIVKLLLDSGKVDPDAKDRYGQTPLWRAAEEGHEAVVKLLLDSGKVDPDAKDRYGRTPLWRAVAMGHDAVVKLLLDTGKVDPDAKDQDGQTPLWRAAEEGHEAVVKLLLDTGKVDPDAKDRYGRTPLWRAVAMGHDAVVKLLLDTGKVDPDAKDQDGQTPLSRAAEEGHEAVVKLLLDTGKVDPDAKDRYGRTPLWRAAEGHEAVIKLLLDTGKVDPDAKDRYGQTPLWRAAEEGHEAVVKLLLDTGKVDPDAKDQDGRTPLSQAAAMGYDAVVKLLLDTGKVDPDAKDQDGQTPLSRAAAMGHDAVVKLLQSRKPRIRTDGRRCRRR
ncbi:hypothetical protein ACHAPT_005514 [Fusarium lateritium]